jgi:hypothetical protein
LSPLKGRGNANAHIVRFISGLTRVWILGKGRVEAPVAKNNTAQAIEGNTAKPIWVRKGIFKKK